MPITVLSNASPPLVVMSGRPLLSPDGRCGLMLNKCQEVNMGGPYRGEAILQDRLESQDRKLGQVRFPSRDFWPWVGNDRMTWLDQKNRPVITTISGEAILVSWKDRRWWRQPPTSLIGHSVPALLLVASFARAAVFDADGGFLYEIEDRGLLPAGFGIDGQCSVISVQDRPYGTAFVRLHDVTTGALLEQIDIRAIDDLLALGLDRPVTSQRSTDVGGKTSWGSWWHGRMMAEYDPDSKTTFLGFRIPTGEMRTVCGEPHAVVESRWVQVAITR